MINKKFKTVNSKGIGLKNLYLTINYMINVF